MIIIDGCGTEETLKQISYPVFTVAETNEILEKLKAELSNYQTAAGLSAIQIGIPKRVAIIRIDSIYVPVINPEVCEKENEIVFHNEGCLSFPDVYFNTKRYDDFVIRNMVVDGNSFRAEKQYYHYGMMDDKKNISAIAVQHEIDHMNGLTYHTKKAVSESITNPNKIGRNELCPCGSNKKYKKCCGG